MVDLNTFSALLTAVVASGVGVGTMTFTRQRYSKTVQDISSSLSAQRTRLEKDFVHEKAARLIEIAIRDADKHETATTFAEFSPEARKQMATEVAAAVAESLQVDKVEIEATALVNEYHTRSLSQSQISFFFSIGAATVGFAFILVSAVTAGLGGGDQVDVALVQGVGGVVIEVVAALFFRMSNQSRVLLVDFFDKLRADEQSREAVEIGQAMSADSPTRDRLLAALAIQFAGVDKSVLKEVLPAPAALHEPGSNAVGPNPGDG